MAAIPALAAELPIPDIPFQKFTLDNGHTLIVHEDHKAPIVAVNVWYHVGACAQDRRRGRDREEVAHAGQDMPGPV